jgi:DNA-binding beta-propeller fold protein YncE
MDPGARIRRLLVGELKAPEKAEPRRGSARRGDVERPVRITVLVVLVALLATAGSVLIAESLASTWEHSPWRLTAGSSVTQHFEYVLSDGSLYVYAIDRQNQLVQTISLPGLHAGTHGIVASPRTGRLYVAYGNQSAAGGSLLALDLRRGRVLWQRHYRAGIDSMAITPDGRKIYMPAGEGSGDGSWRIIDARTGRLTGRAIHAGAGAHNGIMSADGRHVYLAGVDYPYLEVASIATDKVTRKIGPLNGPGVRPFTVNGSGTLAFTIARSFFGFQVSDIQTGKVLFSVPVPGFRFDAKSFGRTPNHGISLSPNEQELYLIDTPNGYVHVFDVSGLPAAAPHDVADIKLLHPPPSDGWLQHSRDGRYVYVGRAGDVIDTRSRKVVAFLPPLERTADFLEIDWRGGRPVATTNRYGVGYVRRH